MKPAELLDDLRSRGVVFSLRESGQLHFTAPAGLMTPELLQEVKRLKSGLLNILQVEQALGQRQVIHRVAEGLQRDRLLSNEEFTERYMILMRAHRNGTIDDRLRDEGLELLLDHWESARQ